MSQTLTRAINKDSDLAKHCPSDYQVLLGILCEICSDILAKMVGNLARMLGK